MSLDDYNPNSKDAQFATIITRLNSQDRESLQYRTEQLESNKRIESLLVLQNGRVRALENEKWTQRGFTAGISLAATAAWQYWTNRK